MSRYVNSTPQITGSNGSPIVGAKKYFYEPGTVTLKTVYSDSDFSTPIANPVLSLAGGYMPNLFIDGVYKEVQKDASDVVIWTRDPVGEVLAGNFSAWISDSTYDVPAVVYASSDDYYITLVDGNQGNEPSASPSEWQLIPVKDMASRKQIIDDSGNEIVIFTGVSTAVNEVTVTNAASGDNPSLTPSGETNLDLDLIRTGGTATISTMTVETAISTLSGASADFTVPSWAKKITMALVNVSVDENAKQINILIGDSGGFESTGYDTSGVQLRSVPDVSDISSSTSFRLLFTTAVAALIKGVATLTLTDPSTNTWSITSTVHDSSNLSTNVVTGHKSLSATLDRVQFITDSNAFDNGKVNILIEG